MAIVTDQLYGYWNSKQGIAGTSWGNIAPNGPAMPGTSPTFPTITPNGMLFDGSDDVVVFPFPNGEAAYFQEQGNAWTFEFWARVDNADDQPDLWTQSTASRENNIWVDGTNYIFINILNKASEVAYSAYVQVPITSLAQIAITYDPIIPRVAVYINGLWRASVDKVAVLLQQPSFALGSMQSYAPAGILDSVKLYKKALTLAEIQQNFNNGLAVGLDAAPDPGIVVSTRLSARQQITTTRNTKLPTHQRVYASKKTQLAIRQVHTASRINRAATRQQLTRSVILTQQTLQMQFKNSKQAVTLRQQIARSVNKQLASQQELFRVLSEEVSARQQVTAQRVTNYTTEQVLQQVGVSVCTSYALCQIISKEIRTVVPLSQQTHKDMQSSFGTEQHITERYGLVRETLILPTNILSTLDCQSTVRTVETLSSDIVRVVML